jgi:hypothetical protein
MGYNTAHIISQKPFLAPFSYHCDYTHHNPTHKTGFYLPGSLEHCCIMPMHQILYLSFVLRHSSSLTDYVIGQDLANSTKLSLLNSIVCGSFILTLKSLSFVKTFLLCQCYSEVAQSQIANHRSLHFLRPWNLKSICFGIVSSKALVVACFAQELLGDLNLFMLLWTIHSPKNYVTSRLVGAPPRCTHMADLDT